MDTLAQARFVRRVRVSKTKIINLHGSGALVNLGRLTQLAEKRKCRRRVGTVACSV